MSRFVTRDGAVEQIEAPLGLYDSDPARRCAAAADRLRDRAGCPAGAHEARIIRDPRCTRRRTDRVRNATDRQARRQDFVCVFRERFGGRPGENIALSLDGGPLHFFDAESGWAIAGG